MQSSTHKIGEVEFNDLRAALALGQVALKTGPLSFNISTKLVDIAVSIHRLYTEHTAVFSPDFSDFHVEIKRPLNLRRVFRPQVDFIVDGDRPFEPLPRDQAPALLEWGMNWSIAAACNQWLTIHAASLERSGLAVILPAPPGSGKSTLCAGLALRGWRLLSDELTLLDHNILNAYALARPINLKNASIDLIKKFEPDTIWGPTVYDTHKGLVTHLAPPAESVRRISDPAVPRWIVFPQFVAGADAELTPASKAETFIELATNAFNYSTLGELGFEIIRRVIDHCDCYRFRYSRLDDAVRIFDRLADER